MTQFPVVLDLGSHTFKVGLASEDAPSNIVLNRLAQNKNDTNSEIMIGDLIPVGNWNRYWRGLTRLIFPVQSGMISEEKYLNAIMKHLFYNELRVSPDESSLLMSECPAVSVEEMPSYRRKMINYLMEDLNLREVSFIPTSTLSAFAQGELNAVVVEIGEETNHVSSVVEGRTVSESMMRMNSISGLALSEHMSNISQVYATQREIREYGIGEMKKDYMYVALDYEKEMEQFNSQAKLQTKSYDLPSSGPVEVPFTAEACKYTEALFNPNIIGIENGIGVHECILQSIKKVNSDSVESKLYRSIILSGGSTLLTGFDTRLREEMIELIPDSKIRASPERGNLPWIGGSIIGSMSNFQEKCITRDQFLEEGIDMILQKFQLL
ncbi:hypothetical protein NAEGRDRAFT_30796 [Naegleria gruberi]|uniref:Actin n=1 Tax=Naegleria gruberi TaxID=5762 RepID=D2V369_NAEGR|nr:uncharacterized protein NAEGRDRAFT_30796 [Naegleria gruberi]EFC48580.1 hypothetical protein NAEGRDRAFT_30796 [Naegleria gruberi]|eukprot:XP_002681324.1 hypothetical protein NAEGRDRAFT_30796 [Naegleria gruberi strain NEG-M]